MSPFEQIGEYNLDYVWIKFAQLPKPTLIPWIEVASGIFVAEESTTEEIVFLTKKLVPADQEDVVSPEMADDSPSKTHLKRGDLIAYLESRLRSAPDSGVIDYGPIEDIRMQPAGKEMTSDVYQFLLKHGVK